MRLKWKYEWHNYYFELLVDGIRVGHFMLQSSSYEYCGWLFCCVNIEPEYQGRGYGSAMMKLFIRWCKRHNIKGFSGEVYWWNEVAQNAYLGAGMKLYQPKPYYTFTIYWPEVPENVLHYKAPSFFLPVTREHFIYET